jgi:hypothetical protein
MKIQVHIERLVLEGLPVSGSQGPQIRSALQKELMRLLSAGGLSDELRGGMAVPSIRVGVIPFGPENQGAKLGRRIARAVHEGIGQPQKSGVPL